MGIALGAFHVFFGVCKQLTGMRVLLLEYCFQNRIEI